MKFILQIAVTSNPEFASETGVRSRVLVVVQQFVNAPRRFRESAVLHSVVTSNFYRFL